MTQYDSRDYDDQRRGAPRRQERPRSTDEYSERAGAHYAYNSQYPPPPQGNQRGDDYAASVSSTSVRGQDPRNVAHLRGHNGVSSPQPNSLNQVAPFDGQKAHAMQQQNFAYTGYQPYANLGYGGAQQTPGRYRDEGYGSASVSGDSGERERTRRPSDRYERESRAGSSKDGREREGHRERDRKDKDGHKDKDEGSVKDRIKDIAGDHHALGSSLLAGAGGAIIGRKLGGTAGLISGMLAGAVGANMLDKQREKKKQEKEAAEWDKYYAHEHDGRDKHHRDRDRDRDHDRDRDRDSGSGSGSVNGGRTSRPSTSRQQSDRSSYLSSDDRPPRHRSHSADARKHRHHHSRGSGGPSRRDSSVSYDSDDEREERRRARKERERREEREREREREYYRDERERRDYR